MIQVQFRLAIVAGREQLDLDVLTRADTTAEERMIAESLLENWQARMLDVMVKHRPMRTYPVRRRTCGECATKDVCKRWQHPDDVGCPFVEAPNARNQGLAPQEKTDDK
jgi:hypothetical protein